MLVGDTYVDPVEWWDAKWVETHVESQLSSMNSLACGSLRASWPACGAHRRGRA